MVSADAGLRQPHWVLRDWLAAAGLFLGTAGVVLWQNAHLAVLWDLSYVLDSASRIALGQLPYRDFPFAHAPLTFVIQASIIRLTGRVFFHHVLYAAIVGGLGTVLTWRIVLRTVEECVEAAWVIALVLASPLTVLGVYCILPLPSYDCDCVFSILVAVWLLQVLRPRPTLRQWTWLRCLATGAALCVPVFFKQNIGLPFLAAACGIILSALVVSITGRSNQPSHESWIRVLLAVLAGVAATLVAAVLLLHFTVGLDNYYHWTIEFAARRRLPGFKDMLGVYHDSQLLWTLPCMVAGLLLLRTTLVKSRWAQATAAVLLTAPFIFTLCSLFIYDDADERGDSLLALWPMLLILSAALALWNLRLLRRHVTLAPLLPFLLLVAINGTLMSQQLWGSTYATWPLLIVLIAEMIAYLAKLNLPGPAAGSLARAMACVIAATLIICGGFYTASEERLSYAQLPDGPLEHSTIPQLRGMAVAGPYLPDFEELLRYAYANIPFSDGVVLIPGEDPFYFVTGRVPQFPVLLFDPATDPYSPPQIVEEARLHQIRWLIVKRNLQIKEDPTPQREATLNALMNEFMPAAGLQGYEVYRRH
jgi:hypothetical protein